MPEDPFGFASELRTHEAVAELAPELTEKLHQIAVFERVAVCLHNPLKNTLSLRVWEGDQPDAGPVELPVEGTTAGWVWENQQPLGFADVQTESRFEACLDGVKQLGMHSFCELPLTTKQRRLGTLSLGSTQLNLYTDRELSLLKGVVQMVALSLENVLSRNALERERERLQALLEISASLISNPEISDVFPAISDSLNKILKHDHASITLYDSSTKSFRRQAVASARLTELLTVGTSLPLGNSPAGQAFLAMETKIFNYEDLLNLNDAGATQLLIERGVRSVCCAPMITNKGPLGTLNLGSHQDLAFKQPDTGLLKLIAGQLAVAIENRRVHCEVAQLKDKLAAEKRYLEGEVHSTLNFEEMIGESPVLTEVLRNTKTVASSDATVLILGETGTGKELLARAIHRMSPRKDGNFIKLNCAAIPTGLLESELFGHEKGAFTGAISQKIGRLELADKGTLLLDEVGDIPLELQPKLLRVLQDREFERLGSTRTIRVDIRLIAATNRDLAARVEEREFRSDLYYRLNVITD